MQPIGHRIKAKTSLPARIGKRQYRITFHRNFYCGPSYGWKAIFDLSEKAIMSNHRGKRRLDHRRIAFKMTNFSASSSKGSVAIPLNHYRPEIPFHKDPPRRAFGFSGALQG